MVKIYILETLNEALQPVMWGHVTDGENLATLCACTEGEGKQ